MEKLSRGIKKYTASMKKLALSPLDPLARTFLAVFVITTLEGAVRKWVWPGATIPLLVLRDALVLWALMQGTLHGGFSAMRNVFAVLICWSVMVAAWASLQLLNGLGTVVVAVIGIRAWLLYLWFAVLCARLLTAHSIQRLLWFAAYLVVPMAALGTLQHFLPIAHILNRQADSNAVESIFTVADGIVRVTGTFSFTAGYVSFLSFVTPIILAIFAGELGAAGRPKARFSVCVAFFIGVVVSGSRGAFIGTGIMLAALVMGMLMLRRRVVRSLFLVVGAMAFAYGIANVVFERAIGATQGRFESASQVESLMGRILSSSGEESSWDQIVTLGQGIGMGNNAAGFFLNGSRDFLVGEAETDKMLGEAGFLGAIFTLLKWLVGVRVAWSAFGSIKKSGTLLPWLMSVSVAILLLAGNLTSQLTAHAYGWLAIALALALNRTTRTEHAKRVQATAATMRGNLYFPRGA